MNQIAPTGVNMNDYQPTNTALSCPTVQAGVWEAAASPLPPPVNVDLCKCMYSSLSCVVSKSIDLEEYGQLFGTVCGLGNCDGIQSDATNGTYGAYSVCNSNEQLSFAFNQYYLSQNKASGACDFGGAANIKGAASASGSCGSLLSAAGSDGTGTVGGGASAGSGSSSTSKAAAGHISIPSFETAYFGIAAYMLVAGFFGAGMILL
jgi:hypothetical protein